MSINVNIDDYQIAQDLLDNSNTLFATTSEKISSVMTQLDGQVLNYVKSDLALVKSTVDSLQENKKVISQDISTEVSTIKQIEEKAAAKANEIANPAVETGATEATPITGGQKVLKEGEDVLSAYGDLLVSIGEGVLETSCSLVTGTFSLLTGNINGFFDSCKSIFNAAADIAKNMFSCIKESIEALWQVFSSTAASIANLVMSLVEGIVSFVEAIVDAAAMIVGAVASIFTGIADGINWVGSKIFGYEFKSATKAMWADGIMPFVGTNWTGKAFDALYTVPPFTWIEENAYGPFKREGGIIYEIGKGVGYTIGLVAATVFTCGVAGGTSVVASLGSTGVSTAFAGLGAMGKNTQKGYNSLSEEEKQDGWSLFKVGAYGVGSGVIEAGAWYFTFGKGKGVLKTKFPKFFEGTAKPLNFVFDKVLGTNIKFDAGNMAKVFVQFGKTYANASNKYAFLSDNPSVGGYFKDVWLNTENLTDATIAGGISLLYDKTAGDYFGKNINPKVKGWFDTSKNAKPSFSAEAGSEGFEGAGFDGAAGSADQTIADSGLWTNIKDAAFKVVDDGGAAKIFGGGVKKFMDYRNIWELLAVPGDN